MILSPTAPATGETWHRVDVCNSAVLACTRVSLIGVLDARAIETIDDAIQRAEDSGHTFTVELDEISSITPDALAMLLTRSHAPYDGRWSVCPTANADASPRAPRDSSPAALARPRLPAPRNSARLAPAHDPAPWHAASPLLTRSRRTRPHEWITAGRSATSTLAAPFRRLREGRP